MKILTALIGFLLIPATILEPVFAEDTSVILTLEDAITLAHDKSSDARVERLNLIRSEQDVKAAKGRFKTNINMFLDSPNFTEQVQDLRLPDEVPIYNTVGRTIWRSSMVIRQPLPTNGSLSLRSNLSQMGESVFRNQFNDHLKDKRFSSSFRLTLRQPLFVPNTLKLAVERANLNHEQARREYTRTELEIEYRVTEDFFRLYDATRGLEIAREDAQQQGRSYELARKKYEAGLIPEVEALQMEVDLAQSRNALLEAEGGLSRTEDRFKMTVGLPLEEKVAVRTDFELKAFPVDEEKAIQHGLRHRAEIRQEEIDRRLAEITLKETDARSSIRGDIVAYYDLTGVSDPFLTYNTGTEELIRSSFDDLRRRPQNRGVQFTLSLPLWDSGVNRAEVAAARSVLQRNELTVEEQKRQVVQQIRAVVTRLSETRARLEALKRSEEVALRGYEITLARFDNGDITSQELALDRDRLTQARQNYLQAYIDYQLAAADLKRQTLYDWENNRSLVKETE